MIDMLKKCESNKSADKTVYVDCDYWMNRAREESRKQKEKEWDVDNWLFDSEEEKEAYYKRQEAIEKGELEDFPEEYYNYDLNGTPAAAEEEKILTRYDFLNMDFKECQYHIYKQLVNISSSLSAIKEVLCNENKAR